jgi:hypothetical protein
MGSVLAQWGLVAAVALGAMALAIIAFQLRRIPWRRRPADPAGPGRNPEDLHYYLIMNERAVDQLHGQIKNARTTTQVVTGVETNSEGSANVLEVGHAGYSHKTSSTETTTIPPVDRPQAASEVEQHMISNGQAAGFDFTLPAGQDDLPVNELIADLRLKATQIGLKVPTQVVFDLSEAWRNKSNMMTEEVTSLVSFVQVRARFRVVSPKHAEDVVLEAEDAGADAVTVQVRCERRHVQDAFGPFDRHRDAPVKATCFATHTRDEIGSGALVLNPIFMYLS